jgi:hypothetical protein
MASLTFEDGFPRDSSFPTLSLRPTSPASKLPRASYAGDLVSVRKFDSV